MRGVSTHYRVKQVLHGVAHITGGGLAENLERILPVGVHARLDPQRLARPGRISPWLQRLGDVTPDEMDRVFKPRDRSSA